MTESTYSEFVYGKLKGPVDSGYQLIARTATLPEGIEPDKTARQYSFWGLTPPVGKHWAIALISQEKELVLAKKELAGSNGTPAVSGCRNFDTSRYLFLPMSEAIEKASAQSFQLLDWMYQEPITLYTQPDYQLAPLRTFPLDSTISAIVPKASDNEEPSALLWRSLQIQASNGEPLLLQALSAILSGKRLLLGFGKSDRDLSKSLLLLLPAVCRLQVAIAMGTVEESVCHWAQLIIKLGSPSRYGKQPDDLLKVNTDTKQFSGQWNPTNHSCEYIESLKTILQTPEQCVLLLQQLDAAKDMKLSLASLKQPKLPPSLAIQLSRALPIEQQFDYLCQHLSALPSHQWISLLPHLTEHELRFAWSQIFSKATTNIQDWVPLLHKLWLRFSTAQKITALKDFQIPKHPELVSTWIATTLLERTALANDGPETVPAWRSLCQKFIPAQVRRNWEAALNLTTSLAHCEGFGPSDRFWLYDSMLENMADSEKVDDIFNHFLSPLLVQITEIETSHIYQRISERSSTINQTLQLIVSKDLAALGMLPELAGATKMAIAQQDSFYASVLQAYQSTFEQAKPLLESLLNNTALLTPSASGSQIALTETVRYFYQTLPELEPALKGLQDAAPTWKDIETFAELLRDHPDQTMVYADQLICQHGFSHLKKDAIVKWLTLIESSRIDASTFQTKSQIWQTIDPAAIAQISTMPQTPIETLVHALIQKGRCEWISGTVLHQLLGSVNKVAHTADASVQGIRPDLITLIETPQLTCCYKPEDWLLLARELWLCEGKGILRSRPPQLDPASQQRLQTMVKERIRTCQSPPWLARVLAESQAWHLDHNAQIDLLLSSAPEHCSTTLVQSFLNTLNNALNAENPSPSHSNRRSDELSHHLLRTQPVTEAEQAIYKTFLTAALQQYPNIDTAPQWLREVESYAQPSLYEAVLITTVEQRITHCLSPLKQEISALMRYAKKHQDSVGEQISQQLSQIAATALDLASKA